MKYFRIKTEEEINKKLPSHISLSKEGGRFFRQNGNKVIWGEIERKYNSIANNFFSGILFNKIDKSLLNLEGFTEKELKWMEGNFIITEVDYTNTNSKQYLLGF